MAPGVGSVRACSEMEGLGARIKDAWNKFRGSYTWVRRTLNPKQTLKDPKPHKHCRLYSSVFGVSSSYGHVFRSSYVKDSMICGYIEWHLF